MKITYKDKIIKEAAQRSFFRLMILEQLDVLQKGEIAKRYYDELKEQIQGTSLQDLINEDFFKNLDSLRK
jgi:hypothetical protein